VYRQTYGDCNVPYNFAEDPALGMWVKYQRRQYKIFVKGTVSSSTTMKRFKRLKSMGFVFNLQQQQQEPLGYRVI